ncbi:hypothetical protein H4S08_000408 [Coemansia sp. RSA 1365]|nr:hypothetical protein H4S08_000408 [Coemansia sp. RSA 1365]
MEYFAKFTRHIGTPRRTGGTTQLAKFEKAWKTVQSVCYYQSKWQGTPVDTTPLPTQLQTMFDLLVQEDIAQAGSGDWTTGACMEYLLGNAVLDELVRLAEADQPLGVRAVVVSNLATFISLADDKLLVQKAVHNPVLDLLRQHGSPDPALRADDATFVDLLYAICSKIRGDPMLLNIFFQDRKWLRSVEQRSFSTDSIAAMMRSIESLRTTDSDASSGFEFLLFSHLLRFVHRDGAVGDTARTSLLFLLELATTEIMASTGGNTALELFILDDSGFAAILSATLGAMYSRLPRSLQVTSGPAAVVPESFPSYSADLQNAIESSIFTSDHRAPERWTEDRGPVSSASPEFRACLTAFASLLSFIQEVLYRCPSPHVCSQLLANLRSNFLQSILYPSLLESSDSDGSSVAVMRYLETMLQVARHEDLVSTIMDFLTDETPASASPSDSAAAACLPFTLRDLIYSNLQSSLSMDAVVSALNMLRLILTKHCRYSSRLIEVERVQPSGIANAWMVNCTVTIDVHRQELAMYARMMAQLQGDAAEKREPPDTHLHIPWRHTAASTGGRPRTEARALIPELFTGGYDSYLEDAAFGWDAHQSYHAELDALFAAQAARDTPLEAPSSTKPTSSATPARAPPSVISAVKQRKMRPRKYSEAIMVPVQSPGSTGNESETAATGNDGGGTAAQKHQQHLCTPSRHKYSVKQSDPIVRALMNLLTKYFAQPRECNLALTGVLAALVGCPFRTLDMWLGFSLPALLAGVLSRPWAAWMDNLRNISDDEAQAASSDSEGEDNPRGKTGSRIRSGASADAASYIATGSATANAMATANATKYAGLDRDLQDTIRQLPHGATPPSLYLVLSGLVQQAIILRTEIPDFARRLKRARNALMGVVEDVDDLNDELERPSFAYQSTTRNRDRGLSSASLESTRPGPIPSPRANQTSFSNTTSNVASAAAVSRSRSTSTSTVRRQKQLLQQQLQPLSSTGSLPKDHLSTISNSNRARSNSATYTSEAASSVQSASTGTNPRTPTSYTDPVSAPQSPWHALSAPPANANLAEFLENVIILQESIKEIIARVQVRRENGGDENAVI